MPAPASQLAAILWMAASGVQFSILNATMRWLTLEMDPFQAQFLRYGLGCVVMLPFVLRAGLRAYRPHGIAGQAWRGVIHTAGLLCWFVAMPHVPLAEMTALGFTNPIFIMLGAMLVFRERAVPARWLAAAVGFLGVLVVVAPQLSGSSGFYSLVMLASSPLFAASFLITKALTRRDSPAVIVVWQSITVALFSLPFALLTWRWPTLAEWGWFLFCAAIGTSGHICLTRAFRLAEMSVTQPVKFLELIWAVLLGLAIFGDVPGTATLIGAAIIFASTSWITRREMRGG